MKFEYKDRKFIQLLLNNSRISTKELAKETKISQQNASFKLKKLQEDKIITQFSLLIDSSFFGYNNFCVFFRIKKYSKHNLNHFISELKKYPEITAIEILFGKYDLFLRFTTLNTSQFNKILKDILTKFSKQIITQEILTQIVLYEFPSNYLSKKKYEHKTIMAGDREEIKIDEIEKKIINFLNENSRENFSKIAFNLDTTPKTIISRIKNLEKKKIIKGYSIVLNHKKLELKRYYLYLKTDFHDEIAENNFTIFIKNCDNIIEHIKVFGLWDNILIIETNNDSEFKELLYIIKEKFADSLDDYNFLESEEIKLWKYIPQF